jgi:hypothetical protein
MKCIPYTTHPPSPLFPLLVTGPTPWQTLPVPFIASSSSDLFLGAKSTSILSCVGWSVGRLVGRSVCPHDARLRGKIIVTSRLIREEEEEEETDYVAILLRRVLRT